MNSLRRYVFVEHKRRRRDDRLSLLIAFGFCLVMAALGQRRRVVMGEGLAVLAMSMFLFTYSFCRNAPKQ